MELTDEEKALRAKIAKEITDKTDRAKKRALKKYGITMDLLARKLAEELEATEIKVFSPKGLLVKGLPAAGEEKEEVEEDGLIYSKPLIAWGTRQKARMDAQELMGLYPPKKNELSGPDGGPIPMANLRAEDLTDDQLAAIIGKPDAD